MNNKTVIVADQHNRMSGYYVFQSKIYDMTRWSFLFGRLGVLKLLPYQKEDKFTLAEIGCGTGFNMEYLAKQYPNIQLIGVDVSEDMLNIAQKKLTNTGQNVIFHHRPYTLESNFLSPAPDVILFSYALTMINPQWKELIQKAYEDLPKGGKIMVADFHNSTLPFFKKHMSGHHVRMDGHILPVLEKKFRTLHSRVHNAYGGVWQYFMYVGEK